MLVIDFDELYFGELFEIFGQRARNVVERAIRLTSANQIHVCNAICKSQFAVAGETVEDERESLVAFHIAGTLEKFIEHSSQQILV